MLRLGLLCLLAAAAGAWLGLRAGAQELGPVAGFDVSGGHACVLDGGGALACWGEDAAGQVSDSGSYGYVGREYTQVATGRFFTCALRANGSVECWGYPDLNTKSDGTNQHPWDTWFTSPDASYAGWVATPGSAVTFKDGSLSVGNYHACGILTTGEAACWGKAGDARLVAPLDGGSAITDWLAVDAGFATTCGVRGDGSVQCWGRTTWGRADGPGGSGPYVAVTMGVYAGCALADDGSVDCWGVSFAQPGNIYEGYLAVITPPSGVVFAQIDMAVGSPLNYSCGIDDGGSVHCWGIANDLQLTAPTGSFAQVKVGNGAVCAVDDLQWLTCWGESPGDLYTPPPGRYEQVDGGHNFACALGTDRELDCWGSGAGINATDALAAPAGRFSQFSLGEDHGCAIVEANDATNGTLRCWGADWDSTTVPTGTFSYVDSGGEGDVLVSCAIVESTDASLDGTLDCFGTVPAFLMNMLAVPGDDVNNTPSDPSDDDPYQFKDVAVGQTHVCAIIDGGARDGEMLCWGQAVFFPLASDTSQPNDFQGVGNHTSTIPPSGTPAYQYTEVTAGEGHNCAIRTDQKAVCWGYAVDTRNYVPGWGSDPNMHGFGNVNYKAIATGGAPNCAITQAGGALECWNNEKSQFLPGAAQLALRQLQTLGGGQNHMCAIDGSDRLHCWGGGTVIPFPLRFAEAVAEEAAAAEPGVMMYVVGSDGVATASASASAADAGGMLPFATRRGANCSQPTNPHCGLLTAADWTEALTDAVPAEQLAQRRELYTSTVTGPAGSEAAAFRLLPGGRKGLTHEERPYEPIGQAVELNLWLIWERPSGLNSITEVAALSQAVAVCLPRPAQWQPGSVWAVWDEAEAEWTVLAELNTGLSHQICVQTTQLGKFQPLIPSGWSADTGEDV